MAGIVEKWDQWFSAARRLLLTDIGLLLLRLSLGFGMIYGHGWNKFINYGQMADGFADPIGLGPQLSLTLVVFAEFFCSILVFFGLATRLALIPLIINMAVAFFIVHAADDFGTKEKAWLYLWPYVALFFTGPGRFSIDGLICRGLGRKKD